MRIVSLLTIALVFILFSSCSSVRVSQDFDEAVDFTQYRTFGWAEAAQPRSGDIQVDNQLLDRRIRNAIEQNLLSKGYTRASEKLPDILVAYRLTVTTRLEADTFRTGAGFGGYRGYYGWGGVGFETRIREYEEGTLVIDIGDARKDNLVWRGTGSRRVTRQPDPQETTRIVNQTVAEILKQYPPQKK